MTRTWNCRGKRSVWAIWNSQMVQGSGKLHPYPEILTWERLGDKVQGGAKRFTMPDGDWEDARRPWLRITGGPASHVTRLGLGLAAAASHTCDEERNTRTHRYPDDGTTVFSAKGNGRLQQTGATLAAFLGICAPGRYYGSSDDGGGGLLKPSLVLTSGIGQRRYPVWATEHWAPGAGSTPPPTKPPPSHARHFQNGRATSERRGGKLHGPSLAVNWLPAITTAAVPRRGPRPRPDRLCNPSRMHARTAHNLGAQNNTPHQQKICMFSRKISHARYSTSSLIYYLFFHLKIHRFVHFERDT